VVQGPQGAGASKIPRVTGVALGVFRSQEVAAQPSIVAYRQIPAYSVGVFKYRLFVIDIAGPDRVAGGVQAVEILVIRLGAKYVILMDSQQIDTARLLYHQPAAILRLDKIVVDKVAPSSIVLSILENGGHHQTVGPGKLPASAAPAGPMIGRTIEPVLLEAGGARAGADPHVKDAIY
jgi:hypothetical protein